MSHPTEAELCKAFARGADSDMTAHLGGCAGCRGRWDEIARLRALTRELPAPALDQGTRDAIRAALVAGTVSSEAPPRRRRWLAMTAAALAAAAALVVAVRASTPARTSHASIRALPGSVFVEEGNGGDGKIQLHDGAVLLEVTPLGPGERFRVLTADAEVEVRGTAFQVVAVHDRLVAVSVSHGKVEVRPNDGEAVTLGAGESWPRPRAATMAAAGTEGAAGTEAEAEAVAAAEAGTVAGTAAGAAPLAPTVARHISVRAPRIEPAPRATPTPSVDPPIPEPRVARTPAPTHAELSPTERAFMEGFAALRSGDAHAATVAFERAATDSGGIAEDASFWRAVALRRDGRAGDALRAFAGFLDRFPRSPRKGEAAVALGWLELQQGQTETAATHFRLALDDAAPRVRASAADGLRTATFSR